MQNRFSFLLTFVLMRKRKKYSVVVAILFLVSWFVYGGEITRLFSSPDTAIAAPIKNVSLSAPMALDEILPLPLIEENEPEIEVEPGLPVLSETEKPGIVIEVAPNDTLTDILARHQVVAKERYALCRAVSEFYDLRRMRPGHTMEIFLSETADKNGKRCVERFRLMTELDVLVEFTHTDHSSFAGAKKSLPHNSTIKRVSGSIDTSFFVSASKLGVSREILTAYYNMLGARVDFQREIRKGDTFYMVYEEHDDSPYGGTHAGRLLYASLTLKDKTVGYYHYKTHDGFTGFFDERGNSVDTRFLKTPLRRGVLSSSFGRRMHPVLGYKRMHRGIDFSARRGTPVLAAGDGVIERVGTYGNYGKFIKIRHGSIYMTGYAHLNGYAKGLKPGMRVSQGDVIGYVGSTGLASGPNLHYEIFKHGKRINPLTLKLPPIRTLHGEELLRFREYLKGYDFSTGIQSV